MLTGRKSCYAGKQFSLFLLFILISGNNIYSQEGTPDPIKNYPGIPLVSYLYHLDNSWSPVYDKIDSLGIHSVIVTDLNSSQYGIGGYDLGQYSFKIILDQRSEQIVGTGNDLINKYTEAKYSVWQAEGTRPEDGEATLKRDESVTQMVENDTVIATISEFILDGTELINGPQYWQEGSYFMVKPDLNIITYTADFYLKIEDIIPSMNLSSDTICILLVTASYIDVDSITKDWDTLAYYVIDSLPVLYEHFDSTNRWQIFSIEYDLRDVPDYFFNNLGGRPPRWNPNERNHIQNVEYKIKWKGNSESVKLYMDKVILSDDRGRLLQESSTQAQILNMLNASYITGDYSTKLSGWIGLDEPGSIDNFEPIRIVNELLESRSGGAKLWISLSGSWNGHWGEPSHPSAGERIHKVDEFFKRVTR